MFIRTVDLIHIAVFTYTLIPWAVDTNNSACNYYNFCRDDGTPFYYGRYSKVYNKKFSKTSLYTLLKCIVKIMRT